MGGGPRTSAGNRVSATREITVGHATPSDVPDVVGIERRSFSDPWSADAFHEALRNPRVHFACARAAAEVTQGGAGRVLGYVVAWFVLDEGEIANLAVAPETRGRGVGSALLDAALAEAGRRSAKTIYLEVRASNGQARALYDSRGFVEVGRRRGYYRRPVEDAVILRHIVDDAGDEGKSER